MKTYIHTFLLAVAFFLAVTEAKASSARLYTSSQMTSSLVKKICQDAYGFIWEGTEYGLNRFDGYHFVTYYYDRNDSTSIPGNETASLVSGSDGSLWAGFSNGLARYDYDNNKFVRCHFPDGIRPRVSTLVFDKNGDLLVGTAGYGLFRVKKGSTDAVKDTYYNIGTDKFCSLLYLDAYGRLWRYSEQSGLSILQGGALKPQKSFNINGSVKAFFYTKSKELIVVASKGIYRYDYRSNSLVDAGYDLEAMGTNPNIGSATMCRNGDILLGTSGSGVWRIDGNTRRAEAWEVSTSSFSLSTSSVNEIIEDRTGNIWINCYKKGLLLLNNESAPFHLWSLEAHNVLTGSSISSISPYAGGALCVLPGKGLFRFDSAGGFKGFMNGPKGVRVVYTDRHGGVWVAAGNTLYKYNVSSSASTKEVELPEGFSIKQIVDNGNGRYYLSSPGRGLAVYDSRSRSAHIFSMKDRNKRLGKLCNDWINEMYIDRQGLLWICTSNGISCLDTKTGSFLSQGWKSMFDGENCTAVSPFGRDKIVVGTSGNLYLYDRKTKKASVFPNSEQLSDKAIRAIVLDNSGDLWISTMNGIWQYDHKTGNFVGHISGSGLTTREYNSLQAFHTPDDMIVFGTPYGVTVFRPSDVRKTVTASGQVFLTDVVIGGREAGCTLDHYNIANDEKTFSMSFSLLDYRNTDNIVFQYRINGGGWMDAENYSNTISFNRMRYGNYVIEVRALSNGQPLKGIKKIKVTVEAPWYLTTAAFVLYALMVIVIITISIIYYNRRKNRELEEAKMRFLINTTHDIRSPLTLILGPLKKLKGRVTDTESQQDIETIDRNANRLLTLVNQILDKRKIDKRQLQLHCRATDLVGYVGNIVSLYQFNAKERGITFTYIHPEGKVMAWIDRNQFDKVVANLLSNAFKYTPDGGEIELGIRSEESGVSITVADTGSGIPSGNLTKIFDRFYQDDNSRKLHVGGTGIGLSLCRALTLMHGGTITAGNRTDGHSGAVFTVTLPLGNSHLKPEQIEMEPVRKAGDEKRGQATRNFHVMVVDDDAEVSHYIKQELGDWYHIEIFNNGKDALHSLLMKPYDIVVSDVVMPEMDGITLLKNIKKNSNISDIPVILLTSQSEVADRLEGLRRGADAYIAKPFNMDELHVTIDNLVDNVRRLKGKFSGAQQQADKMEDIEVEGNDDELMKRVMESVNKHLDDPDFNVEKLCEDIAVSRTQLHRKMKKLTGISAGEFIRNLRIEQAAKLIKEGKITVTQVAYAVGFNNASHFATVFKKHFGMTPTEYANQNAAEKS